MRIPVAIATAVAAACLASPLLPLDPFAGDAAALHQGPSAAHWLGTDGSGRDVLARLLFGGRVSLAVAITSAIAVLVVGSVIGLVSGWYGGVLDATVRRTIELNLAVPKLPLMLLLAAIDPSSVLPIDRSMASVGVVVAVVVLFGWTTTARLARAFALQARGLDYVVAASALGLSVRRILWRHVFPGARRSLVSAATISIGEIVLYESALSFLGLGVRAPTPSWGGMLSGGLVDLSSAPLSVVAPAALTLVVAGCFRSIGDRAGSPGRTTRHR
jgi:peptide/nickel transport system permease protein